MNELPTRSSEERDALSALTTEPTDTANIPLVNPTTLPIQGGVGAITPPCGASGSVSPNSEEVSMISAYRSQQD